MLAGGAVADPDGATVGVAGPAVELGLGRSGPAVEGEQDREAGSGQAAGVEEPGEEGAGLLRLAGGEERGDADAGVAGPGVAVVPVAGAADPLGQRGGRGGDRRTGRRVGEQLQRHAGCAPRRRDGWRPRCRRPRCASRLSSRASSAAATAGGTMMSGLRRAAVSGDRHRCARADLEVDGPVGLDRRAVGGDGDGEVAALAHQRTRPAGDAPGGLRGRTRSGGRGGAGRRTGSPAGGEPADEHGAGQEPAFDLGDETVGELELAALDGPGRGQGHGVGPVGAVRRPGRPRRGRSRTSRPRRRRPADRTGAGRRSAGRTTSRSNRRAPRARPSGCHR